jgi:hypothetical protein
MQKWVLRFFSEIKVAELQITDRHFTEFQMFEMQYVRQVKSSTRYVFEIPEYRFSNFRIDQMFDSQFSE